MPDHASPVIMPDSADSPGRRDDRRAFVQMQMSEIQMVLAEKRTSLAVMRTGIVVFGLPMSILTVLIATSKYYDLIEVAHFLVPVVVLCAGLLVMGAGMLIRGILATRRFDRRITAIKHATPELRH